MGVKRVTRVYSVGADHTMNVNDSTDNMFEGETSEAWRHALQGGQCRGGVGDDGILSIQTQKCDNDDGFCATAMFAGPRAAAALRKRGSATSADEQVDAATVASDPKRRRIKKVTALGSDEASSSVGPGPGVSDAREQEKLKNKAVRLAQTARKTIQERMPIY